MCGPLVKSSSPTRTRVSLFTIAPGFWRAITETFATQRHSVMPRDNSHGYVWPKGRHRGDRYYPPLGDIHDRIVRSDFGLVGAGRFVSLDRPGCPYPPVALSSHCPARIQPPGSRFADNADRRAAMAGRGKAPPVSPAKPAPAYRGRDETTLQTTPRGTAPPPAPQPMRPAHPSPAQHPPESPCLFHAPRRYTPRLP